MAKWTKRPFEFTLIGLVQGSASKPYEIVRSKDLRTGGKEWVSCNCPSYVRGRQNKNMQNFQRSCKHTKKFSVNDPEIDFTDPSDERASDPEISPGGRIPFQKPQLPARWKDAYEAEVYDNSDWVATVKMDGHRALVVRQPYGKVEFFSRGGKRMMSVEPAFQDLALAVGNMLDTELVVADISACNCPDREGQREAFESVAHFRSEHPEALKLVVLDVLFMEGKSVMNEPYEGRRIAASIIVREMFDNRVEMVETKPKNISTENWLVEINESGAEGVVFWNRNSPYRPGIRSSTAMLKKKWGRVVDVDVVVVAVLPPTEKTPGHRLAYGYAPDLEQVGIVPGILGDPEELKRYVGQVVELKAHEVLPSGSLLYPEFVRWREKPASECVKEAIA